MADPLLTIDAGENYALSFIVRDESGGPLALSEVREVNLWLISDKPYKVVKAWSFIGPDQFSEDIEAGDGTGELVAELLPSEIKTPALCKLVVQVFFADTDYITTGAQADNIVIEDFLRIREVAQYGIQLVPAPVLSEDFDDIVADDDGTQVSDDDDTLLVA